MKTEDYAGSGQTAERLVEAVLDLWMEVGRGGISARAISQRAQSPASAINYHFGGLEQLLSSAQHQAITAALGWCESRRAMLDAAPELTPAMFAPWFAALVDDWCEVERRLALAWREGQLLGARNPAFAGHVAAWRELWEDFWRATLARFGLERFAAITAQYFDGEAMLHTIRWQRPIDRACIEERAQGWVAWLGGNPAGPGPWRAFAKAEAERLRPRLAIEGPVTRQIGAAAAELLGREGTAGLTHRAVAAQAGLSLGTVTYHFRTSPELLQAAFDSTYRTVSAEIPAEDPDPEPLHRAELVESMAGYALGESHAGGMLAMEELFIAAARDSGFRLHAAVLRYSRGQSSLIQLQRLAEMRWEANGLDAALWSNWAQGLRRDILARPEATRAAVARESLETVCDLLCGAKDG